MHHRVLQLHQDTSRSAVFETKSYTRPCSTDPQHKHQRSEAPSSAHVIFGTEGNNVRPTNSNFMGIYFNSGKMKVENTNTRLKLRELRSAIDVSPVNKMSVNTNDGQTLLSKVEEPISCEALNPYGTGLPQKSTFLRRGGTSHNIPPEKLEWGYITDVREIDEAQTINNSTSTCREIPEHGANVGPSVISRSYWYSRENKLPRRTVEILRDRRTPLDKSKWDSVFCVEYF